MTASQSSSARTSADVAVPVAVWSVAVVMWLYYLAPFVALASRPVGPLIVVLGFVPPALALGLLVFRRRARMTVVVGIGVLLFLSPGVVGAAFAMQGSVARWTTRARTVMAVGLWFSVAKLASLLLVPPAAGSWGSAYSFEFGLTVVGLAFATLVGWLLRTLTAEREGRMAAEQARRDAEWARIEQARLAEREQIAREMHDVLAHRLSLVSMNAGALAFRTDLSQDETREIAKTIQCNVKQSLAELRAVLSTLRGSDAPPEPPQPTLAELPVLVADLEEDQRIDLEIATDLEQVPTQTGRQAFRIVQEALTNARKHAPGAPVSVRVAGEPGARLEVTIINPLADLAVPDDSGSGVGLLGLTERASSVGGLVNYGRAGGSFVVSAYLPWKED